MQQLSDCKICSSKDLRIIKRYTASRQLGGEWLQLFDRLKNLPHPLLIRLGLCLNCGFLFYLDSFTFREMKQFYEEEARYAKSIEHKLKPGRRWEIEHLLTFLRRNLPKNGLKTGLDLGAGDFVALDRIVKQHPKIKFEAVDPSYPQNNHDGIKVHQTMIEDFKINKKYDLVTAIHILEHVGDLHTFMTKVSNLVNTNGYFYVEVPFQVGPGLLLNRSVSVQHVNYYTPATISYLLSRYEFNLVKIELDTDSYRYNGMPGMIRLLTTKKKSRLEEPKAIGTFRYLVNPFLIIRSKMPSRVLND
jgi:hypothetical protein